MIKGSERLFEGLPALFKVMHNGTSAERNATQRCTILAQLFVSKLLQSF